ncbi:response regulator transcription factor [Chitinophaga japonensis]|uniref:DNA-binding NarL/FixJ family response regulator n=1 Tax=Chitinophaga japonensis TaxID=104662 RepID=A0A562T6Q7_CHIJA|nr:response regulator transcription factor [Chitinophaga japonensis]TWI88680.1 DNA-binding NarL/FixJ family response regulator [Chitinophaga japonensis]
MTVIYYAYPIHMISIGIIEDNYFQLCSYKEFFEDFRECRVAFACLSMEAFRVLSYHEMNVEVILLDLSLPGESGMEGITRLRCIFPEAKIIILSAHREKQYVVDAIRQGAHGYIVKTSRLADIYQGIQDAIKYGGALCPKVAYQLISHVGEDPLQAIRYKLTEREYELLTLLKEGHSYKVMAERLHLSVFTINHHLKKIYQKLNVSSKSELVSRICLNNLD